MQPDLTDSKPVSFALYHQFIHWKRIFKLPGNSLIQNLNLGCMHAQSLQSCPTVCDPVDGSLPGSSLWDSPGKNSGVGCHFLLQCIKVGTESEVAQSCPTLATPWTAAYQAPPSMGFSRQEYWSGVPLPSPCLHLFLL